MGKLKRSSVVKNQSNKSQKFAKQCKLSIEELLENAEDLMDQFELEKAYQYVKRALDIDPKHVQALETMASVQMEMGNTDSARNIYKKLADELSPNEGFSKYMCLAQLSGGQEAVNYYLKGIELMLVELEKQEKEAQKKEQKPKSSKSIDDEDEEDEDSGVSKADISTAYGSLAELYLTDLCMEENADVQCKTYLDKSLEYDGKNPESLQLMASYWLSKDDKEQAKRCILESVDLWLPKYVEASESGLVADPTQVISLTYDSRINTTRILCEVEEYDKAIDVLEQLIDEDDEVVVIWYMLGWVNHCKGQEYYSNAKYYLKKAQELATKIKYEQRFLDDELRSHIKELLDKLVDVKSDEEEEEDEEDKENVENGEEDDLESSSDEEEEDENNNEMKNGHKNENGNKLKKNKREAKAIKDNNEEPMELT